MAKRITLIITLLAVVLVDCLIGFFCNMNPAVMRLEYDVVCSQADYFQIFYNNDGQWLGERGGDITYDTPDKKQHISVTIPHEITQFRIDLGNQLETVEISNVTLKYGIQKHQIDLNKLYEGRNYDELGYVETVENGFRFYIGVEDPFLVYTISEAEKTVLAESFSIGNILLKIFVALVVDVVILLCYKYRGVIQELVKELLKDRRLIFNLSLNDFKVKYAGSYLGITWAFVQPVVNILVYWFVFQYGLRSASPEEGVPYVLWFVTGLIPWFFFSEAINNGSNSFIEYSYLVKKVKFRISILPIIKILSSFYVHIVFLAILLVLYLVGSSCISVFLLQILYYSFCLFCLVMAIAYVTSAIVVFVKDLSQIINIFLQVGMWMTPILWSYTILSEKMLFVMKLNPMFYIVEGYRDSFIGRVWFFGKYFQTIYFWAFTACVFLIGTYLYKKLKPHFSDVL